jgi:4-hydroxybenzoate polyprenyltransferase
MAEVGLFVAVVAVPILIGVAAAYSRRPWWWGAIAAIAVFLVAAIAPAPEDGESRVTLGDVGFLVVVALFVSGLVWLGTWSTRRVRSKSASMN